MTYINMDNNELLSFLYRMPVAVVGIAANGDIKMLTPQAAAFVTPLSRDGNFSNLFSLLDPITSEVRELIHGYEGSSGVICDHLIVPIAANTVGRHNMVFGINVHKIDADNLMVMFTDITNATYLEEELLHRTAILDALPENICVINAEGVIVTTNRAWDNFTHENNGLESRCGVGTNYFSVGQTHKDNIEDLSDEFVIGIKAVLSGTLPSFVKEYECHSPNKELWGLCRASPVIVSGERFAVISHENITWRKHAENKLRKLSRAVEQSPASIIITDAAGNIEFVNRSFTELTGYCTEETMGLNPNFLKSGELPAKVYEGLCATISSGKTWEGELHNRRKDGSTFWEHAIISPLYNENATITNYIAVKDNISEKRNLTKQLMQSQKMEAVGQLAGGIAHDFNNKLMVLLGNTDLAKMYIDDSDKILNHLQSIRKAAEHSRDITHRLLSFSRQDVAKPQTLDANPVIAESLKSLNRFIGEHVALAFDPVDNLCSIRMDPVQLDQIVMNLAINARDAMPDGGTFTIKTRNMTLENKSCSSIAGPTQGDYISMSFHDTGIGMNKETQAHLFEPFFTTKEVGKGTGLGLATVYGIVGQANGFIEVDSELGSGSTITIYLPRDNPPAPDKANLDAESSITIGKNTILLVEDEDDVRSVTSLFLKRIGYVVYEAATPNIALELIKNVSLQIDLVLTDYVMPEMSGWVMMEKIRKLRPNMKCIFASGYSPDCHHR